MTNSNKAKAPNISLMVKIALLSAIAFVLTIDGLTRWRLPIFPAFLAMDVSDVPGILGAIVLGPVAGVWIMALKNVLSTVITGSISGGIGPFANFLFGVAYLLPMIYLFNRFGRSLKGFVIGAAAGTVVSTVMAALLNYYMLIPAYAFFFGGMDNVIEAGARANEGITGMTTMLMYAIIPFNLLKNALVSVVALVLYKALPEIWRRAGRNSGA